MTEFYRLHGRAALRIRHPGKQRNGPVTTTHVSPAAWVTALGLADGDRSRLRVISATTVVVVNRGSGRRTS